MKKGEETGTGSGKPLYAEIIVDISLSELDRTFSYRVPEALREQICVGAVVEIPFGAGGRTIKGCVVDLTDESSYTGSGMKEIRRIVTDETVVDANLVRLAAWMKEHNASTMNQALRTVLPWRRTVKDRVEKTVTLSLAPDAAGEKLKELMRKGRKAQARVLEVLIDRPQIRWKDLLERAGAAAAVVNRMAEQQILSVETGTALRLMTGGPAERGTGGPADGEQAERDAGAGHAGKGGCGGESPALPAILSPAQSRARDEILKEWQGEDRPALIFGVTGSGKTLVYMELIERVLEEGRQAIVLIPEIALTYQTVERFKARFGSVVSFLHSRLSDGEKYDQFRATRSGQIRVMVGPRSALFTPFPNLGLIVVDEEHEESYHSEHVPRYHARETACARAAIDGAHVVLGSATPSLTAYHRTGTGEWRLVTLTERFGESELPSAVLIDMKEELKAGNRSILSRHLHDEITDRLTKRQQVMLFLNRRGLTGFVTCRACGHVEKCPHCDVSLTQHKNGRLICHYCGYEKPMVSACPVCGSTLIGGLKAGTEMVESHLMREFPGARILRMDRDTTRGKAGHEEVLRAFGRGEADILLGTQMIVKGHDYPRVTLVGVLLADLSLNDSDYRSSERTFQLVMQAVGRGGRGADRGLAVIQSYDPGHYALVHAAAQDYPAFYKEECLYRKAMTYPPFSCLTAILGASKDEDRLTAGMTYLRRFIDKLDPEGRLGAIGPAPMAVGRIKDTYRQVIYIRHRDEALLIEVRKRIERYLDANKGFDHLNIQFDFNA